MHISWAVLQMQKPFPLQHTEDVNHLMNWSTQSGPLVACSYYHSVTKSCLTLSDFMDCSMTRFPVLHCLLEVTQTHVHWVDDAIQSFHPLSPSSPPALNLSQYQGLFNELALHMSWPKCWEFQFQTSVFPMNIQGWVPLGLTGLISLLFKGLSRFVSSTAVWKQQFFGVQPFLLSSSHIGIWLLENHSFDYMDLCQ